MPTKWTGNLSEPQLTILAACAGRGILGRHLDHNILPVWRSSHKTVMALVKRGLVRECVVPKDARNGVALTRLGAATLVPPVILP